MYYFLTRYIDAKDFRFDEVGVLIDWVTASIWPHVEIGVATDPTDPHSEITGWIGARAKGGVQLRPYDYLTEIIRERRYAVPVTEDQYNKIMAFARSKIGTPYNFEDIAGLFLHVRSLTSKDQFICSMFHIEAAMAAGLAWLNVLPGFTYWITPETDHLSPILIGNCIYDCGSQ